jgi:uncharacterized protein
VSIEDRISSIVSEVPEICAAWVFGSVARGNPRPDSDLDVAVLLEDPRAGATDVHRSLRGLAALLEDVAGRAVDIAVLGLHDPVFAHDVLSHGRRVLDRNRARRIDFECAVLSRYFDWAPVFERTSRRSLEVNREWARRS